MTRGVRRLRSAARRAEGSVRVLAAGEDLLFALDEAGASQLIDPRIFSFNTRLGACASCEGKGYLVVQKGRGKKAREEFKVQVDKAQAGLKKQKDDVENLRDQLEKKQLVMKEEERHNLEKDLARKGRDFERGYKDSQAELQAKDNELTAGDIGIDSGAATAEEAAMHIVDDH